MEKKPKLPSKTVQIRLSENMVDVPNVPSLWVGDGSLSIMLVRLRRRWRGSGWPQAAAVSVRKHGCLVTREGTGNSMPSEGQH